MKLRVVAWILGLLLVALPGLVPPAPSAPLDGRDVADDIFYMYMPIAWRDSDNDAQRFGDFGGMTAALPYLRGLGVTAVWMTPIFPSPAYHGYQHGPANQLNPWFGTEPQFLSFVGTSHADSVKVFIDLVAYQISQNSVYFQNSYLNNASPYTDYLSYYDAHSGNSNYLGGVYNSWNGAQVGSINWNLNNTSATDLVTTWSRHWLDPNGDGDPSDGIDGFRLDHVSANDPTESYWGYDIAWWQGWKLALQAVNPSVFTFAEQADWGSHGQDLLTAHDATFTKPFEFAVRNALSSGSAAGLYSEMQSTLQSLPAGKTYLCTLGDHDVDRLMSSIGDNAGRAGVAAAIQMTQPFPPVIYFGDELGMRGTKANYGSDANDIPFREPFKWNAVAGPPMSNYFVLNSQAYTNRVERDHDGRSVEEEQGQAGSLLETYRKLIFLRRNHAALRRGTYTEVANSSGAVWSFCRFLSAQETLLVAVNVSGSPVTATLDLSGFQVTGGSSQMSDLLTGASYVNLTTANRSSYSLPLPAYGYVVLRAGVTPPAPPSSLVDGRNIGTDFGPGSLVATQNNATGFGDNVNELDQMYARPDAKGLYLGVTGNIGTDGTALALFFDTVSGGQNTLQTSSFPEPPSGFPEISGMVVDTGFNPDVVLFLNAYGGNLYVDDFNLSSGGGGTKRYVGGGALNTSSGLLSGGSNPNGMQIAFNDSNTAGVTSSSAANASTATRGLEALVPWADLLMSAPGGSIRMMAMMLRPTGEVSNQFLPGLGGGRSNLGFVPINLNGIPGAQYATISTDLPAGVPPAAPAAAALRISPNPSAGATSLRFGLATESEIAVRILDAAGRLVREIDCGHMGPGPHRVPWDGLDTSGRRTGAGIYLAQLRSGAAVLGSAKLVRVR